MTARRRGRPPADRPAISPATILSAALELLDTEGFERFTMRALAMRVGVTPMTIYHHYGDRDGLIRALGDAVYADVVPGEEGDARTQIERLLEAYRTKVVQHPGLALAIFHQPTLFPAHATRITRELCDLLQAVGLSPSRSLLWTHILVDYTHGAALAIAMQSGRAGSSLSATPAQDADYQRGVRELLDSLACLADACKAQPAAPDAIGKHPPQATDLAPGRSSDRPPVHARKAT